MDRNNRRRTVVTGIGVISPLGLNAERTWEAVVSGKSGIGPITVFDASTFPVRVAAEVRGYSVTEHARTRRVQRLLSRAAGFGLGAARMAWDDAGFGEEVDGDRVGVILGSCVTAPTLQESSAWCRVLDEDVPPELADEDPFGPARRASHTGTAQIAEEIGARGRANTIYVACASGTQAIGMATRRCVGARQMWFSPAATTRW